MVSITKDQFKTILSLNNMIIASLSRRQELAFIQDIFENYTECGANILIAPTYLTETEDEKKRIIEETFYAAQDLVFVAGEVRAPVGISSFEDYRDYIKRETSFLSEAGVSMIFLNGFNDLAGAKYALISAREACELPISVGLSFGSNMCLKDGCAAINALVVLQSLGADAVGCVFDTGTETALDVLSVMSDFTTVPLFAFLDTDCTPAVFSEYALNYISSKCAMLGAVSTSAEEYISEITKASWQLKPFMPDFEEINAVCSRREIVFMDFKNNIVGENKNILEIKIGDEMADIDMLLSVLNRENSAPVCFNTKDPEILRRLLYEYVGRPAVISDEYGEITARELGAVVMNHYKDEKQTDSIGEERPI